MKTPHPNRLFAIALVSGAAFAAIALPDDTVRETATPNPHQPIFAKYQDLKWNKILPALGEDSPEICILRVDPKTQATQLLIRTPKAIHVRKHWHSANETHTVIFGTQIYACDGNASNRIQGHSTTFLPRWSMRHGSQQRRSSSSPWTVGGT
jgi:hypothetical protein